MKTQNYTKPFLYVAFMIALISNIQTVKAEEELAPDQNPNYKRSLEKYMAIKDELIKNQGTTVQNTYKAIDDVQLKKERKELRKTRRHERRLARINSRHRYYNRPYYGGYNYYYPYNYGYNNNCINYSCFNTGYNSYNGYGYYHHNRRTHYNHHGYQTMQTANVITSAALLGLGMYLWLR